MAKEKDKKAKELTPAQKKIVEASLDIQFNDAFESNNVSYIGLNPIKVQKPPQDFQ